MEKIKLPKTLLSLVLIFLGIICWTQAAMLPEGHNIHCEHYDEKNCSAYNDCTSKIEYCKLESDRLASCYSLWSIDEVTGDHKIKMKGCFTDMIECQQSECITHSDPLHKEIHFCCCEGSMCNTEQKWIPTTTTTTEVTPQVLEEKTSGKANNNFIVFGICVTIALIMMMTIILLFYYRRRKHANFNEIPTNEAEVTTASPLLSNLPIERLELKANGRFGDVYHGRLHNQDVAVKVFRMQEKDSWNSEIEIYKLPRMNHPNILEFVGDEKHIENIQTEYWLITTYHHNGSLCDYLKSHVITWDDLSKIAESMANGLMYLHEEIPASNKEGLKPSIAHRDFKSKNVLLKSDLTACIADFGLAMIFEPGKSCGDTHGQVGTRRYMAPEVLEGAINFNRDAFLRIDVYACGLVLWEMVSRCNTVLPVAEYQLPFEAELGKSPTLEDVQDNVVTKKLRPTIANVWRSHSGLAIICDTMEECWDHDAEARLSSSCVVERFAQFNKYKATQLLIENKKSANGSNAL